MKNYKYILIFLTIILGGIISCNDILKEEPKDFLSPENSFTDKEGFEAALANIYLSIRTDFYAPQDSWTNFDLLGLDVDVASLQSTNTYYGRYFNWSLLNADHGFVGKWWARFYNLAFQANTIIDRAEDEVVSWESDEEKNAIVGEAKFIRAFAYHFLANMWGGVPLVLEETTSPKFDYTRASQEEVYQQCKTDLEFAVQWMPTVDEVPGGRAPRAAAYHLLAEVNICLEDYNGAITAASKVIDDSNFSLMTERFGEWTDFQFNGYDYSGEYEPWGDVYWDLFQEGNMNWSEGNREAIWNIEYDVTITGGGNNEEGGYFVLERWWGPMCWCDVLDLNGVGNWLKDTLMGRPVGTIVATDYVDSLIWQYKDDWNNDIRNSKYNVQRTYYWVNPASEFYGQPVTYDNMVNNYRFVPFTRPYFKKVTPAVHHGQFSDWRSKQGHDNGAIYKDWYIMRLPETYLLRAEAYLKNGNLESAANDINVVRSRAQATAVTASDVDIDLILDERARELYIEEFRINTLLRTGKLVEYLMKYNPVVINEGSVLDDHLNKLPIPNSEIEANNELPLEQNPGYN